jgi:hypothetical protein
MLVFCTRAENPTDSDPFGKSCLALGGKDLRYPDTFVVGRIDRNPRGVCDACIIRFRSLEQTARANIRFGVKPAAKSDLLTLRLVNGVTSINENQGIARIFLVRRGLIFM